MRNRTFRRILAGLTALMIGMLSSCMGTGSDVHSDTGSDTDADTAAQTLSDTVVLSADDTERTFYLIYDAVDLPWAVARRIICFRDMLQEQTGVRLELRDSYEASMPYEIIIDAAYRVEYRELLETLDENEYAMRAICTEDSCKVVIAYRGGFAREAALSRLLSYAEGDRLVIPGDLSVRGTCTLEDITITPDVEVLRDPCVLRVGDAYYMYGTWWQGYRCTSGDLRGPWEPLGTVAELPQTAEADYWAPEVHAYGDAYYMFTTYRSFETGRRGCTVMRAESPEGPFVEISDGHLTPSDWDAIDGTLYVDEDGQPWMVFVHEWVSTDDRVGRMAAARLSADLTHFVSEPIELFRADDPQWAEQDVTDGCYLYRCADGTLLMIWSNFDEAGYCIGVAKSDNGRIDGNWKQEPYLLYSAELSDRWDGGHGMIFADHNGQLYLSMHSPNSADETRAERPMLLPIREENGRLVWDLSKITEPSEK
ncbi:MAG: family 43 glycosylhydrolase [Clostridia bacterium]|nr:family 43 glycosylhydrolase [Clostridia bacterium]